MDVLIGPEEVSEIGPEEVQGHISQCDACKALRRVGDDEIAQRLFSIILAVRAAENSLVKNPARLTAILELIHTQSAASLETLRRINALP